MSAPLLAAVELGGTKTIVAIGSDPGNLAHHAQFATRTPDGTLSEVSRVLRDAVSKIGPVAALGMASFGPIDVRPG